MIRPAVTAVLLVLAPVAALAQEAVPVIREIAFEGNKVTKPKVMLREMVVKVGDPANEQAIERSRQGVQDLGLFRTVVVRQEPVEGGVRLVFKVKEKHYILPLPRADANSDGGYGYGAQLRWNNLWGLNHTLNPYFERRQPSEGSGDEEERGVQVRTELRYHAPFVFDSRYSLGFGYGYFDTPFIKPLVYDENLQFAQLGIAYKLSDLPGSQGWTLGGGLRWRRQKVEGPDSQFVTDEGRATFLSAGAAYQDLHFNIYSDEGVVFSAYADSARRGVLADYHATQWQFSAAHYRRVGDTPHQTVHFIGLVGARHGGPAGAQEAFSLGGASTLRGFEPESAEGDFVYRVSVEFLRPVIRKSIRLLAVIDAGNAFATPGDANLDRVLVSAGLGVRVRFQAFVNLDLELGVAWPLNGGDMRVFASKV